LDFFEFAAFALQLMVLAETIVILIGVGANLIGTIIVACLVGKCELDCCCHLIHFEHESVAKKRNTLSAAILEEREKARNVENLAHRMGRPGGQFSEAKKEEECDLESGGRGPPM
jgi:hypothetical protein